MSHAALPATAQISDPPATVALPSMNMARRPTMSAARPPRTRKPPKINA
jgi:hypothetical protein